MLSKFVLADFNPTETAILRYGSAALAYFIYSVSKKNSVPSFATPKNKIDGLLLFLVGAAPFAITPILQLQGLSTNQSIDNAVIIAMEPLFTVILAWIFLREFINRFQLLAFGAALIGFLLVSKFDWQAGSSFHDIQFLGFVLMLLSLWGEAIYSVTGKLLSQRYNPISLYGTAISVGISLLLIYGALHHSLPNLSHFTPRSFVSILYLGPLGTTVSYILWMKLMKVTPVASIAITLFIQPVSGSIWGSVFLGERFSLQQIFGSALILLAVLGQTMIEMNMETDPKIKTPTPSETL